MRLSYEIFTVPKKLFELRRCSNNRKSNYRVYCIYQLAKFGDFTSYGLTNILKKYTVSCTNTHHDVTDLVNHEMVKNTKT